MSNPDNSLGKHLAEGEKMTLRGYVRRVRPNVSQVEVILETPKGREIERTFPSEEFARVGLHYEDAPFNYELRREGGKIYHKVYPREVTEEERRMPEIDMSVFEEPS